MLPLLISIIALITNSILAYFIFRKGLKNATYLTFFLLVISYIVYLFPNYFVIISKSDSMALINVRITMAIAIFQTALFYIFAKTFPGTKLPFAKRNLVLLLLYSFGVAIFCFTPWLFSGVELINGSTIKLKSEFGVFIFGFTAGSFIILGIYHLIKKYQAALGIQKIQLLYIIVGTFTTYSLFFFLAFVFSAATETDFFSRIAALFLLPFTILATYAILRYRFMDIRFAVKRGTAHLVSIVIIIAIYSSLILFAQQTLVTRFAWDQTLTTIIAVLIIAFSVEPLRRNIIRIVNQILYSPIEKQRENLGQKSTQQLSFKDKEAMYAKQLQLTTAAAEEIRDVVAKIIGTYLSFIEHSKVYLFMADGGTKTFTLGFGKLKKQTEISPEHPLHLYLNQFPQILITKEIPYLINEGHQYEKKRLAEVMEYLEHNNIEAVIPIGTRDRIVGIFLIGPKSDKQLFSQEDILALEYFRGAAAPILSNLILYRSVQTMPIE